MLKQYSINIPNIDGNGNFVDASSLISTIEALSLDGYTRQGSGFLIYKNGIFLGQCQEYQWFCDDSNESAILTAYNIVKFAYAWATDSQEGMNGFPNWVATEVTQGA